MADKDPGFHESARKPEPESGNLGRRLFRGCAIAVGIALLVLAFVVGACFIGFRA
jgi:hypothetical protein